MAFFDTLIPNLFAADITGVFDQNFNQVFYSARPIKATVKEGAKLMEHPVETGVTITDHRVIMPVEIELSLILGSSDYRSVYGQIKNLFLNATLLTVQTRTSSYSNMLISDLPHDEEPALFNVVSLALRLREVQFVQAQFGTLPKSEVSNPENATTEVKGEQQTKAATPAQEGGVLVKTADWIGGLFY